MARRPEAYHEGLGQAHEGDVRSIHDSVRVKDEAALAHLSVYDRGMRLAAQETLVPGQADADEYRRQRLAEQPCAGVESLSGQGIKLRVAGALPYTKELQLGETLEVAYEAHHDATLFSEWNLSLPEGEQGAPPEFEMGEGCCAIRTSRFGLRLEHNGDEAWVNRLYSVSNTEDGVELAPQGWSLVVRAQLSPEQSRRITLSWAVT